MSSINLPVNEEAQTHLLAQTAPSPTPIPFNFITSTYLSELQDALFGCRSPVRDSTKWTADSTDAIAPGVFPHLIQHEPEFRPRFELEVDDISSQLPSFYSDAVVPPCPSIEEIKDSADFTEVLDIIHHDCDDCGIAESIEEDATNKRLFDEKTVTTLCGIERNSIFRRQLDNISSHFHLTFATPPPDRFLECLTDQVAEQETSGTIGTDGFLGSLRLLNTRFYAEFSPGINWLRNKKRIWHVNRIFAYAFSIAIGYSWYYLMFKTDSPPSIYDVQELLRPFDQKLEELYRYLREQLTGWH